jgi:O-antigen/teichoic acid export membrane protein
LTGVGFATTLILARLLVRRFGVVAIGTAFMGSWRPTEFRFAKQSGYGDRDRTYSTAFTLHAIACTGVAAVLVAVTPFAKAWYGDPRVVIVLLTLAVISVVSGLRNFGMARYERALDFRPFFLIALARKLSSFAAGVGVALLLHDYRALLAGMLVGTLVDVSSRTGSPDSGPLFTLAYKDEVLAFSAWWLASRVMMILGRKGQLLLVGQQLGATALGKYAVALDLATTPTVEIIAPVMRAVPGYMQMKDESVALFAFLSKSGDHCVNRDSGRGRCCLRSRADKRAAGSEVAGRRN